MWNIWCVHFISAKHCPAHLKHISSLFGIFCSLLKDWEFSPSTFETSRQSEITRSISFRSYFKYMCKNNKKFFSNLFPQYKKQKVFEFVRIEIHHGGSFTRQCIWYIMDCSVNFWEKDFNELLRNLTFNVETCDKISEINTYISVDLYESTTIVHICQEIHYVCTYDITNI